MTPGPPSKGPAPAQAAEPAGHAPGRKLPTRATTSRELATGRADATAAARAASTARGVAAAIGLPSEHYRVRADDEARTIVDRQGARGVAVGDTVHLHPDEVRPEGWTTRALLAHELAHVVQSRNGRLGPPPGPSEVSAAEAEAAALAEAVRAGRALWRPIGRLPPGHTARDRDAVAPPSTTPATTAPTTPTPTTSSGVNVAEAPRDEPSLIVAFRELAKTNHKAEIALANDQLTTLIGIGNSEVEALLHTLDALPFPIARAVVQNMDAGLRLRAAKWLNDDFHRNYQASVVALLAGLDPPQVGELEAGSLHGLDFSRIGPAEQRAAAQAMAGASQATLVELSRGDKRDAFRAIQNAGPAPVPDLPGLQQLWKQEKDRAALTALKDDAVVKDLLEQVKGKLAKPSEQSARDALALLRDLATPADLKKAATTTGPPASPTGTATPNNQSAAPTTTSAAATPATPATAGTKAGAPTSPAPKQTPDPKLVWLVGQLDAAGLVERLLDALPESERYAGVSSVPLQGVLSARDPARNIARAQDLLSYSITHWVITDANARYAYLFIRTTPVEVQERWRQSEGGKWFMRLVDNLPDDMLDTGEYQGVGLEYGRPPRIAAPDTLKPPTSLGEIVKKIKAEDSASHAAYVIDCLLDLPRHEPATPEDEFTKVIKRLDSMDLLGDLEERVSNDYLFGEVGRKRLLVINQVRDPAFLGKQASRLLSTKLWDWAVTARDAWFAFQLVRAMPVSDQLRFQAQDPDKFAKMTDEMTAAMRRSAAVTSAPGTAGLPGVDDVRKQLSDTRLWTKDHRDELRAVIDLAYALDDRAFVFALSRSLRADKNADLADVVDALGLYREPDRVDLPAEQLKGTHWYQEGPLQVVEQAAQYLWLGLGALLWLDEAAIAGRSLELRKFELNRLQNVEGDVSGITFADPKAEPPATTSGQAKAGPGVRADEVNRLSAVADVRNGVVTLKLPHLRVSGVNITKPGTAFRTGPIALNGLTVKASFSDRGYHTPAGTMLKADDVDLSDVVAANTSLPGGAWALARTHLNPFEFDAGSIKPNDVQGLKPATGRIPIPVLGPLIDVVLNIYALAGTIPGSPTVLSLMLEPITYGMPFLQGEALSMAADQVLPTPKPFDYLVGLATDGVFRPPRTAQERIHDALQMLRSFKVAFDHLKIDGLSIAGKQQIGAIQLDDVTLGVGLSKPAYLRALIASLEAQPPGGPDAARLAAAKVELASLEKDEARLEVLERKDRWNPGSLKPDEATELTKLSDKLRRDNGLVIDIGHASITDLSGKVTTGGVDLQKIHAEIRAPIGASQYLSDDELAKRFKQGGAPRTLGDVAAESEFNLSVAATTLRKPPGGGPVLTIAASEVPDAATLAKQLRDLPDTADPQRRTNLEQALAHVTNMEKLLGKNPKERTAADEQQAREDKDEAAKLLGIRVESLTLGQITGTLDPKRGTVRLVLHDADAQGIQVPGAGIKRVSGTLEAGVGGLNELKGDARVFSLSDEDRRRLSLSVGATAKAEGVHLDYGLIGEVGLNGFRGQAAQTKDGYKITDLGADSITLSAIDLRFGADTVTGSGATVRGLSLDADIVMGPDPSKAPTATVEGEPKKEDKSATVAAVSVSRFEIKGIDADRLVYESHSGTGLRAELTSGSLLDIRGIGNLVNTKEGWTSKLDATVGGVEQLKYKVLMGSLIAGPPRKGAGGLVEGQSEITGTIQGDASTAIKTPEPGGTAAPALTIGKATDGTTTVDLAGLAGLDTVYRTPTGRVVISKLRLGGKIVRQPDGTIKADVSLPDIDITSINWHTGSGAAITGGGHTRITGVTAKATYRPADPKSDDVARRDNAEVVVERLGIDNVIAGDLHYIDKDLDLHVGYGSKIPADALHIRNIVLTDFHLVLPTDDKVKGPSPTGHVEVGESSISFGGMLAKGLSTQGTIGVKSISLDLLSGGRLVARARGISGDVGIDTTLAHRVDPLHFHAAFSGVDTGVVEITDDAITIGGKGREGLVIPDLTVDKLHIVTVTGAHPFEIGLNEGGAMTVDTLHVSARLERFKPGEKKPSPDQSFKRVVITDFWINKLSSTGLFLNLTKDGIKVDTPVEQESEINDLNLESEPGSTDGGFVITPGATDSLRGVLSVGPTTVPSLRAAVVGKVGAKADLWFSTGRFAFLKSGGTTIDLTDIAATNVSGVAEGDRTFQLVDPKLTKPGELPGIGAKTLHVGEKGDVTVEGAHVDGLTYTEPGITLTVVRGEVPGKLEASALGGHIPQVNIETAYLEVDFTKLPPSGPAPKFPEPLVLKIEDLVDHLNGDVRLTASLVVDKVLTRDLRIPVRMHITDGSVDFQELERDLKDQVKAYSVSDGDEAGIVEWGADTPKFWVKNGRFHFGLKDVATFSIKDWPLTGPDDLAAAYHHRVRLYTFVEDPVWKKAHPPVRDPDPSDPKPEASPVWANSVEISDITADIEVKSPDPIPFGVKTPTFLMVSHFAPDAVVGLHIEGGIPSVVRPLDRGPRPTGLHQIAFKQVHLQGIGTLQITGADSTVSVKTGEILLKDLTHTGITFSRLGEPQLLYAHLGSATAKDVIWAIIPKKPSATPPVGGGTTKVP